MKKVLFLEEILFSVLCFFQFLLSFTIFIAVLARYVFKVPLPELNVLQNFSLVWLIMVGSGIALKNKEHLEIDVFGVYLSKKFNLIRIFIIDIIVMIAILFLLIVGYKIFIAGFSRTELTPIRFLDHRITMVYFNSAFFVGAITMTYYQVINLVKSYLKVFSKNEMLER